MTTDLYRRTSYDISRLLTNRYSTSFGLGIKTFPRSTRPAIYAIYGFVRVADEIVDTFRDCDRPAVLQRFQLEVNEAIRAGISTNPVIHAFQSVVNEFHIPGEYLAAFFRSMAMDLTQTRYTQEAYEEYVYGSAEVVGLMCLKVFCRGQDGLFADLTVPARRLGAAFQKVNFLRDLKADLEIRGRIYLPGVKDRTGIDQAAKQRIEREIEGDFNAAVRGIKKLPGSLRLAVFSAYLYYQELFRRLQAADIETLLSQRIRIPDAQKLLFLFRASFSVFAWGLEKRGAS